MVKFPIPINERERLDELYRYEILDTPPEEFFDQVTQMAAQICNVPIALVSLVDRDRQWFKSRYGLDVTETPREQAFCAHTILGAETFIVEDATTDPRFQDNILVREDPGIRFYAAAPLVTPRGLSLGSLCVIDREPRTLDHEQLTSLRLLANQVIQQLELRQVAETLRRQSVLLEKIQATAQIGGWELNLLTNELTWSEETYRIHGRTQADYTPTVESAIGFYTPETEPLIRHAVEAAIASAARYDLELQIVRRDGERRWVRAIGRREDEGGKPRRVFGVFQDITDRRLLESKIVSIAQREQTRIGFDLHDGLGQDLTGIALLLDGLLSQVPDSEVAFREEMRRVIVLMRGTIDSCRLLAQGLSPTGNQQGGLIGALRALAVRIAKLTGVTIRVRTRGRTLLLDETVSDQLYRIAQEAITNAIKHGLARRIVVSINWNAARTVVSVTNDGNPITAGSSTGGMGLGIMRYRARLIGATLAIDATAAGGTRVRCRVPLVGQAIARRDSHGSHSQDQS